METKKQLTFTYDETLSILNKDDYYEFFLDKYKDHIKEV